MEKLQPEMPISNVSTKGVNIFSSTVAGLVLLACLNSYPTHANEASESNISSGVIPDKTFISTGPLGDKICKFTKENVLRLCDSKKTIIVYYNQDQPPSTSIRYTLGNSYIATKPCKITISFSEINGAEVSTHNTCD